MATFIVFFVIYPIFALFEWKAKKDQKEYYQRKIDEASTKGDTEAAAQYIDALVRYK